MAEALLKASVENLKETYQKTLEDRKRWINIYIRETEGLVWDTQHPYYNFWTDGIQLNQAGVEFLRNKYNISVVPETVQPSSNFSSYANIDQITDDIAIETTDGNENPKKIYHKLCLIFHPDKSTLAKSREEFFLLIQDTYEQNNLLLLKKIGEDWERLKEKIVDNLEEYRSILNGRFFNDCYHEFITIEENINKILFREIYSLWASFDPLIRDVLISVEELAERQKQRQKESEAIDNSSVEVLDSGKILKTSRLPKSRRQRRRHNR